MGKKSKKYVYFFGNGKAEGNGSMKNELGGKGAGLAEMTDSGVPVPPGFTITTNVCNYYYDHNKKLPAELNGQMKLAIDKLEKAMNKKFGDKKDPLLVSVRSGSRISMPGMMDTILNLGLNDDTVEGLAELSGNARFAYDSYRRFLMMFSDVVLGIEKEIFEHEFSKLKDKRGVKLDTDIGAEDLKALCDVYKNIVKIHSKKDFPQDALQQLVMARDAVFNSWNNPRAITYRKLNRIPDDLGTAVNVQSMVFGNLGDDSATGVGFTRNPSTGVKEFYGEYLTNAQGEDVVAGVRTPKPITALAKEMPKAFKQLKQITDRLEKHYRDIQDFEFTIEKGSLFMLQTRSGKRTAPAAIKIAVDMVKEKLITKEEALMRVAPKTLDQLLHPILDPSAKINIITKGLPASPGAATGQAVFTADEAVKQAANGPVILVRQETSPDDIHGMDAAAGILTSRGGMTSHAAVVARGMGKCCVAGCEESKVDVDKKEFRVGNIVVNEGDWITLNGSTGAVILGKVPTIQAKLSGDFGVFMKWADEKRTLKVRANADIPRDARVACEFGAEGIGLCRTEHMFFAEDRIPIVQEMILAVTEDDRRKALAKLLPMQREDFYGLFKEMKGYAVTIRLIDPPLHEFLPKREELMVEVAVLKCKGQNADAKEKLLSRVEDLHEFNPMLGHRGCRLGVTYPEITEMQAQAIIEGAVKLAKSEKKSVIPEIMVPLVGNVNEFKNQKNIIDRVAQETMKRLGKKIQYKVGTMIEVPRAALTANDIAEHAEFFSFGTNDLTQMTYGFSRDDAGKFIQFYMDAKIMAEDPFQTLDQAGVGQLVKMGVEKGRSVRKDLKVGICGEHGGDPESVGFCHRTALDYVSCSPYRVPIARLAAAQAAILDKTKAKTAKKKKK
ncbi:MAG: pyruvate, phosphate dikinase [Elusimicrobiota bacterium]